MPIFPAGAGGSGRFDSVESTEMYVSPNGSDSNSGLAWDQPFKYLKTAAIALNQAGGGTLYVAPNTHISADGAGLVIDGLGINQNHIGTAPIRIIGVSGGSPGFFNPVAPAIILGGAARGGDFDDPAIWISSMISSPVSIENIVIQSERAHPIRIGWNYYRNRSSGAIVKGTVTAADRADGETVFTCDPIEIDFRYIQRVSDVVTVILDNETNPVTNGVYPCPIRPGATVFIDFTNGSFTPAAFVVTGFSGSGCGFTVASAGANFTAGDPDGDPIGTAASNQAAPEDTVTIYGGVTEFPASQYRVTASDEDTITVTDYYGYAPRSATASDVDIGTYAVQDRSFGCAKINLSNVQGRIINDASVEDFTSGPGLDCGPLEFFRFSDISILGNNIKKSGSDYGCRDPNRRAAILFDTGSVSAGIGFGMVERAPISYGGIRYIMGINSSQSMVIDHVCADQPVSTDFKSVPGVEIVNGNQYLRMMLRDISTVDANPGDESPAVLINSDCPAGSISVDGTYGAVEGPCTLSSYANLPSVSQGPLNYNVQTGWYGADRHIAGRHPGIYRNQAVKAPAFAMLAVSQDPDDWTLGGGITATDGQIDPMGGTGAIRLQSASDGQSVSVFSAGYSGNAHEDDIVFAACWVRGTFSSGYAYSLDVRFNGDNTLLLRKLALQPILGEDEWSCIVVGGRVADIGGHLPSANVGVNFTLQLNTGDDVQVYQPTIYYCSQNETGTQLASINDVELAEIMTNIGTAPYYLNGSAAAGTNPGQKFIAHGGIGTDEANAKVVGAGSGELTLTGTGTVYLPTYAKDGTTIIGWVAQLQATVNS